MARTLGWKKVGIVVYLTVFLIAATAGFRLAAQTSVTISGAICDQISGGNSTCSNCIVDFGSTETYCWTSQCDETLLGYRACRTWQGSNQCLANEECWTTCTNCKGWQCSTINPPDQGHSTYWCDLGTCACPNTTPNWTGSWNQWPICNG